MLKNITASRLKTIDIYVIMEKDSGEIGYLGGVKKRFLGGKKANLLQEEK